MKSKEERNKYMREYYKKNRIKLLNYQIKKQKEKKDKLGKEYTCEKLKHREAGLKSWKTRRKN